MSAAVKDPQFMGVTQAAEWLVSVGYEVTQQGLHKMAQRRQIPHFKPAGRILFTKEMLLKWIEEGKR